VGVAPDNQTPDGARPRAGLVDPAALMRIAALELRARVVIDGLLRGIHRSVRHGFSAEFTEYRPYVEGDDLRHLDWRVLARSDRLYLKKFEDETALKCHLVVDHSRSMGYGSTGYTKAAYAATLSATFAQFLLAQGDAVGLVTFTDRIDQAVPPKNRHGHLRRLLHVLERTPLGTATDLSAPLEHLARLRLRRGLLVILSDLLAPTDGMAKQLAHLRAGGHDVVIVQVIDPAERDFTFTTPVLFEDVESARRLHIDPATVGDEYRQRFAAHTARVRAIAEAEGAEFHQVATDRPLAEALFTFLTARECRGRLVRRRGAAGVAS
jgi:uncharacterized protein (DUF58 family)